MLVSRSKIKIFKNDVLTNIFEECENIIVRSSWEELTDTAEVSVRNIYIKNNKQVKSEIQRGQPIEIQLGYNPLLVKRFSGYIKKVTTDSPFKMFCEDEAYLLKQVCISTPYSKQNLTVKTLLSDLQTALGTNITVNALDAGIGTWQVSNGSTIIDVLDELKSKFGLISFFRDGELFIGSPKFLTATFPLKYCEGEFDFYFDGENANIIPGWNLTWNDMDDIRQVIKGVSIKPDNSKIERYVFYKKGIPTVQATQPEGNMITRFQYNISQADLDAYLLAELPLINYTGWKGDFTTFGDCRKAGLGGVVQHGDKVNLHSLKEPEKDGKYLVKSVSLEFGSGGYRQIISLDQKLTT